MEHAGNDRKSHMLRHNRKSHMLRHNLQTRHPLVTLNEFRILVKFFNNNRARRKKQYRPTLNTQENSIALELFT